MFTPQKVWSSWSLTPKNGSQRSGTGSGSNPNLGTPNFNSREVIISKGKGIAYSEVLTPPSGVAVENGGKLLVGSEDLPTDREGLAQRIKDLENELFEYQYNMGLLLIEKKEWTSKYEELSEAVAEAKEALKREQAAHLVAISDVGKREEKLTKALGVEKECVHDLEKALREIRAENAEIKYTADSKLAEANALVISIEEKSLELEAKLRSTDAKLAEISRKSSEIERKSQDLEAQESALRRERLSLIEEQRVHESSLSEQKEDLREQEKKLRDGEERLAKGQRILSQREERANENDRILKQKQKDLEDAQKKIDETHTTLKRKEDDISSRLANLALKEKECDTLRTNLEMKEKELLELEQKLNERERDEIQKLTEEHNAILDAKKREFELEIDQKRKSLDDELKNKVADLEKKEGEINHMEEKIAKREQALEKRWETLREKDKDYESKLRTLKEREKSLKAEEKNLKNEKKELFADKEKLLGLKAELEKIKIENEEHLRKIIDERDRLKVSEEERSEYRRLQSELKMEIDKYMHQKELLLKEAEDLKLQKEIFEREWEELDEKRAEIEKELKNVSDKKEEVEKLRHIEEESLKNEKAVAEEYIRREQESLKLAKESFAAHMELEKSVLAEKVQSERSQMLHDYEMRKRELETELQNRVEEMAKPLREKEKLFEEEKAQELENINYLRELARREMEELKLQRLKIEKERQEADVNKEHLERHQVEIRKDIDGLLDLSRKLKDQREQLMKERERFLSFIEKFKSSKECGEAISEFVLSDLQPLAEIENAELPSPKLAYMKKDLIGDLPASERQDNEKFRVVGSSSPISGGTMTWLRSCASKIFKISPGRKINFVDDQNLSEEASLAGEQNVGEPSKKSYSNEIEAELSFGVANDSFDVQRLQSDNGTKEVKAGHDGSVDDQSNIAEAQEDSQPSDLKDGPYKLRKSGRGKKPRVSRTHSVKTVVRDAKAILGETLELNESEYHNGNAEDSADVNAENQGETLVANKRTRNSRKRNHGQTSQMTVSEHDGDDSEGRSVGIMGNQRKKRRDKATLAEQASGERRYNLRRPTTKSGVRSTARAVPDSKGNEEEDDGIEVAPANSTGVASENRGSTHSVQRANDVEDMDATTNVVVDAALSEEVSGIPEGDNEHVDGDDYRSESHGEDASHAENLDEEEELVHPGEVSIGKKLWTFLTT